LAAFYIDNDISRRLAELLAMQGHDAISARDLGLQSASDGQQLLVAAQRGRIFVTNNREDYMLLHDAWLRWTEAWHVPERHSGIMVVPQGRWYGIDWTPEEIAPELTSFVLAGIEVAGLLLRRGAHGWQRLEGRQWSRWPG